MEDRMTKMTGASRWDRVYRWVTFTILVFWMGGSQDLEAKVLADSGWQVPGDQVVAVAGDVNGDGYKDILVWNASASEVRLYRGTSGGASGAPSWSVPVSNTSKYGEIAGVGDVNGDGFDDVMIGEPDFNRMTKNPTDARVRLFLGSSDGLASQPDWAETKSDSGFGWSISGGSDIDGDGYADVVVGDPVWGQDPAICGTTLSRSVKSSIHVFYGSAESVNSSADWSFEKTSTTPSCLGSDVSLEGDINGDGYSDVVASATTDSATGNATGRIYVFHGSSGGLSSTPTQKIEAPVNAKNFYSFGEVVSTAGDVNNDGFDDLLVTGDGDQNFIQIYRGSSLGLTKNPSWERQGTGWTPDSLVGFSGDINDDGFDDITVVSQGNKREMLHGSNTGPVEPSAWSIGGAVTAPEFGASFGSGADIDADGYDDLVVGTNSSGTYLYLGGPNPPPSAQAATVSSGQGVPTELSLEATDPHDDPITYAIETEPSDGSLTGLDVEAGAVTYEPDAGFYGEDSFEFRAEDPYGNTDTARVTVRMEPDNEPPEFVEPTPETMLEVRAGELLEFQVQAEDPDGDEITYEVVPVPERASFEPASGDFTWRPPVGRAGESMSMTLRADDGITKILREITLQITEPADTGVDAGMDAGESTADVSADAGDVAEPTDSTAETSNQGCGCRSGGGAGSVGLSLVVLLMMAVGRWALGVGRGA